MAKMICLSGVGRSVVIKNLRLVVAHSSDDILQILRESLSERHQILASCNSVAELQSSIKRDKPDLVITGITFPDGNGLDTMIEIGEKDPLPSVIITASRSLKLVEKAMEDHVMAYLMEPVRPDELEAAIVVAESRFEQFQSLSEEVKDLRQALQDRKVIERAKGVLMADGMSELDAFKKLRSESQSRRLKMAEIAQEILDGAEQGSSPS